MGNSHLQFPNEGLQSKNLPSPKLVVSGNMNQSKTGSPKSPKSPSDNSKSDSTSSPLKSVRSPSSTKSSPGSSKSLSLAERLAQSTRGKSNSSLKSPVSKSSPTSPNISATSKPDLSKDSMDQCSKSDEAEQINVCNGSMEKKMDNSQHSDEQDSVIVENEISDSSEVKEVNAIPSLKDLGLSENCVVENEELGRDGEQIQSVVVESLENVNQPLRIDDKVILEQTSKKDIRHKVWEFLEENSLVVFPKPCFNRIPNFKGCITATQFLEKLDEFKKAKTIKVSPDKAQETARFLTLSWGKRLLVPLLRLKEGLLQNVSLPFAEPSAKMLRSASTQKGLRKWGNKLITLDQNTEEHHIDMIILGSVAVDKEGHRIGIGSGFCDLEFVILRYMNMVTDNTIVVTIVHDAQVFDTLPKELFKPYDVPVDIIITPTEIIRIEKRLDRPKDVLWNYISKRRLLEMPPLQLLRTKQEKDIDCTLKDVDSEAEDIPPSPKTYKKSKSYRKRSYSTKSENNDSVFKDQVSKSHSASKASKASSAPKNTDSKVKRNRAKSSSGQQNRSISTSRQNNQIDKKDRSTSKKPNKRRTKSESAKSTVSPVTIPEPNNSNGTQNESPTNTSKSKRRSRQKQRQRLQSTDTQSIRQYNTNSGTKKQSSRSNSRIARRDYIDRQDQDLGREMSVGRKIHKKYDSKNTTPKKYYSQIRRSSYSQERYSVRSNSRAQRRNSSGSVMHQNRYTNGPAVHQTRYFNGPSVRHNSYDSVSRQNGGNNQLIRQIGNNHVIRHNSYSNDPRQNNFYDGIVSRRNSYSKGSTANHQDGYTNSRVFRPPQYRNGMTSRNNEKDYVRESRPHFINNRTGYFGSNEKPNYSRSISGDDFVLKVGNIANNVRVRDLKAALMERGVKPMHITWRGPRGFAYLRYSNSTDLNKGHIIGSLQNVRIKPNGVETAQTQTLIVTECQFS